MPLPLIIPSLLRMAFSVGRFLYTRVTPTPRLSNAVHGAKKKNTTPSVLYAFQVGSEDRHKKARFKVGKTIHLAQRIRPYRTIHPDGVVHHSVASENIDVTERWLHDVLKSQGFHESNELFSVPPAVLSETMEVVVAVHKTLTDIAGDAARLKAFNRMLSRFRG